MLCVCLSLCLPITASRYTPLHFTKRNEHAGGRDHWQTLLLIYMHLAWPDSKHMNQDNLPLPSFVSLFFLFHRTIRKLISVSPHRYSHPGAATTAPETSSKAPGAVFLVVSFSLLVLVYPSGLSFNYIVLQQASLLSQVFSSILSSFCACTPPAAPSRTGKLVRRPTQEQSGPRCHRFL